MRNNKDVFVLQRESGSKLFLVALQLKNGVGAVGDFIGRLEGANFIIDSAYLSSPDPDGYARCSLLIEAPKAGTAADDVREIIEKSKSVAMLEVKEAHKGLLIDSLNFPVSWNTGDRVIMLRTEFFTTLEAGIRKQFESGADVVLYEMGYHHGEPTWRNLLKSYEVKTLKDLQEVLSIYIANGWGMPEAVSMDLAARTAEVKFSDNFECMLKRGQTGSGSNFVRGHLKGFFEVVFGSKVEVNETACIAKGDPTCTFSVTPRPGTPW